MTDRPGLTWLLLLGLLIMVVVTPPLISMCAEAKYGSRDTINFCRIVGFTDIQPVSGKISDDDT